VYGLIDLIGDIGGIIELMALIFGLFIGPFAEHDLYIKATKKFYLHNHF
jgi:hypothetical protein